MRASPATARMRPHVNTVLGAKGGPVEIAWATSLATPTQGHTALRRRAAARSADRPPCSSPGRRPQRIPREDDLKPRRGSGPRRRRRRRCSRMEPSTQLRWTTCSSPRRGLGRLGSGRCRRVYANNRAAALAALRAGRQAADRRRGPRRLADIRPIRSSPPRLTPIARTSPKGWRALPVRKREATPRRRRRPDRAAPLRDVRRVVAATGARPRSLARER